MAIYCRKDHENSSDNRQNIRCVSPCASFFLMLRLALFFQLFLDFEKNGLCVLMKKCSCSIRYI